MAVTLPLECVQVLGHYCVILRKYHCYFIFRAFFMYEIDNLQPDGCKLFVLLTFSYAKEK